MNAELIRKEVAAVCDRRIARLKKFLGNLKLIRRHRVAIQQIHNLQDLRYRWCESSFLDRCQQRIKEELQEQN